jgi:hypothetical protein
MSHYLKPLAACAKQAAKDRLGNESPPKLATI